MNKFSLKGKTALITGAAGLLGKEHAKALLANNATVILSDISKDALKITQEELSQLGNVKCITMDVTSINSVKTASQESGLIDILINNAAIDPKVSKEASMNSTRLENYSLESWNHEIAVGLTGAFICSQVFGSIMAKNSGGVILNIASDLGVIAPDQRLYKQKHLDPDKQPVKPVTYSVIKHGLIGLTKYLATYWPDKNIRVNSISPGGVFNNQPDDFVEKLSKLIPMGRMASADEYQGLIQFLCSDASSYITGQNIVADGGRSVW